VAFGVIFFCLCSAFCRHEEVVVKAIGLISSSGYVRSTLVIPLGGKAHAGPVVPLNSPLGLIKGFNSLFTATQYLSRKSVLPGAIFSCLHSVSAAMREGHPASWTALFEYYSLTHRS